jgi:hypothetical protein
MAATKRTSSASRNGSSGAPAPIAKVKEAGESVASAGAKAKGPLIAAGAGVAGLAGGLALGRRLYRPRGFTGALVTAAQALARTAEAGDEVKQVREQLSRANRRSPVEVLLDGLTHRRGAHRAES